MSSKEVQSAVGEAPTKLALMEHLAQKRDELAEVQKAFCDAERVMDTDRALEAQQRITILRGFIARLETEVHDELEVEGKARAEEWQADNAKALDAIGPKIKAAQTVVRKALKATVEAIKAETELRAWVEQQSALPDEILSARFGLPRTVTRTSVSSLPEREDWVMPVLLATDAMRPERLKPRGLAIPRQASDTPEILRRKSLRAVAEFNGTPLPSAVRAILNDAPITQEMWETPEERKRLALESSEATIGTKDPVLQEAIVETLALGAMGMSRGTVRRG